MCTLDLLEQWMNRDHPSTNHSDLITPIDVYRGSISSDNSVCLHDAKNETELRMSDVSYPRHHYDPGLLSDVRLYMHKLKLRPAEALGSLVAMNLGSKVFDKEMPHTADYEQVYKRYGREIFFESIFLYTRYYAHEY